MTRVTSRLLTLLLTFAMVFTSLGWLGSFEANAAEGDTVLYVKLVDGNNQPVAGISLKGQFMGDSGTDFTFDGPSNTEGIVEFDSEDEGSLLWVDEDNPND